MRRPAREIFLETHLISVLTGLCLILKVPGLSEILNSSNLLGELVVAVDCGELQDTGYGLRRAIGALVLVSCRLLSDSHLHTVTIALLRIIFLLNQPASQLAPLMSFELGKTLSLCCTMLLRLVLVYL